MARKHAPSPKRKPLPRLKSVRRKNDRERLINFKVSNAELASIRRLAKKYTAGNVSTWMRYAAVNCRPAKKELAS